MRMRTSGKRNMDTTEPDTPDGLLTPDEVKVLLVCALLIGLGVIGVFGVGPIGEERVGFSQVDADAVEDGQVVPYEELSAEEQQMFREVIPKDPGEITPGARGEWQTSAAYVELDGTYYAVSEKTAVGGVWFYISLMLISTGAVIGGLVALVVGAVRLPNRLGSWLAPRTEWDLSKAPRVAALVGLSGLLILFAVAGSAFIINETTTPTDMVAVSESPVIVDDAVETNKVLHVTEIPGPLQSDSEFADDRHAVTSVFEGGSPVARDKATYEPVWSVERDNSAAEHLQAYDYVQSDGELYRVTIREDVKPGLAMKLLGACGLLFWLGILGGVLWLILLPMLAEDWKMMVE